MCKCNVNVNYCVNEKNKFVIKFWKFRNEKKLKWSKDTNKNIFCVMKIITKKTGKERRIKRPCTTKHEGCIKGQSTGSESAIALGNNVLRR